MSPKQAQKRYWKVFYPSIAAFMLSTGLASWAIKGAELPLPAQVALALMPAACIIWFLWGHGRWLFEIDEYQREQDFRALLGGVGVTLAFCTTWGMLEMLVDAPKFPVYYIFVLYTLAYSACKIAITKRVTCQ